MKRFFCKIMLSVLSVLFCISGNCTFLYAETNPRKLVRVGYIQLPGFLYQNESRNYVGLAYELLEEIATYNNWDYEFHEISYSQSEQMLNDGEIDFFVPYQKTPERQEHYEFGDEVFCTNQASLLTQPDTDIAFNEYSKMNGITIGAASGTRNGERFQQLFDEQGVTVTIRQDYDDQKELIEAMKNGEIDAFISASNRSISNCKIISHLDETNSFAVGKKGDRTYVEAIDRAIRTIQANTPGFWDTLNQKYMVAESGSYPSLTREEMDYIQAKPNVKVIVSASECDSNGNFASSSKQLFDRLSEMSGLQFEPVVGYETSQMMEDFTNGKSDLIYSFNHDYDWANKHNAKLTNTYAEFYNTVVTKGSTDHVEKVAVVSGSYFEYYLETYRDYELVKCASYQEGVEMVRDGKVDATILTSPIGNYYSTFPKYKNLSFVTNYDFMNMTCMAVSDTSAAILVDILNKCMNCIPQSELSRSFETQMLSRKVSFVDFLYENPIQVGFLVAFIVAVIAFVLFLSFYAIGMQKKNKELAIANAAKTDFFARMSHDMRTPMNGILGMLQLSEDETDLKTIKENLVKAKTSGTYMLSLINDTLDLQKMEAGKIRLDPKIIQTKAMLEGLSAMLRPTAEAKGLHYEVLNVNADPNGYLYIDPIRVSQIFNNLMSNAIKFTPTGGTVGLKIETLSKDGSLMHNRFTVWDTGVGMSEEFIQNNIYHAYSQEKNEMSDRYTGTGLGLAIVKNLVDMMHGSIEVNSELGKGTRFTILLDFPHVSEEEAIAKQANLNIDQKQYETSLEGKVILVAEDNELNAEITRRLLEKVGVKVRIATNGQEAVDAFLASEKNHLDLILMDIRMPVMTGLEATRAIRAFERSDAKTIPIIAMTANAYDSDVEESRNAGMNAHLAKPIDPALMYETIAKNLK